MQVLDFDTAGQALVRRGDFWLDEVCSRHLGVLGRTYAVQDPFFFGRLTKVTSGAATVTSVACSAGVCWRRPADVRNWAHDRAVIMLQRGAGLKWQQRRHELQVGHGDLLLADPDDPYFFATEGNFDLVSFYVPVADLKASGLPTPLSGPLALRAGDPAGGLAAAFAGELAARLEHLTPDTADRMLEMLGQLVSVAAGQAPEAHAASLRQARHLQALRHIEANLADPALSPASCARALGVSVRALHLAFEAAGETFTEAVTRRRLERSREMIMAASPDIAVADIAFACGFGSLAGFYRAFGKHFGARPSDLRRSRAGREAA